MKTYLLLIISLMMAYQAFGQRNCAANTHLEMLLEKNPEMQEKMQDIERQTAAVIRNKSSKRAVNGIITIPVVFHVVYNRRSSSENIPSSRLYDQLQVLNEDFRRMNSDASSTPGVFSGLASDTEIEFCLATVDPSGSATDGITRTSSRKRSFGTNDAVKSASSGGTNPWPTSDYLNIWVCNIGGGILGYAQFPGGPAATDGIVLDYRYTGTTGAQAPFNLGRTGTHEVGHWLNLRHIWGDTGCGGDDFVSDTPLAGSPNYTGSPCNFPGPNTCSEGTGDLPDMFQNYMDYSDDACMNLYTTGQTNRMRAIFEVDARRAALLTSNGCGDTGSGETCSDGILNNGETDVDCGGPNCDECPPNVTCEAPTGLLVSSFKRKNTGLSWNASAGAISYTVNYNGQSKTVTSTSTTIRTEINVNYTWSVTANCSDGSATSIECSFIGNDRFSAECIGARAATEFNNSIEIYPNPANNELNVDISNFEGDEIEFRIYNASGSLIKKFILGDANQNVISIADFDTGLYLLNAQTKNGGYISKRFMVVK